MAGNFQHVKAGEPVKPRAGDWNAMLDAARAHQAQRGGVERDPGRTIPDRLVVRVKNNSGAARPRTTPRRR